MWDCSNVPVEIAIAASGTKSFPITVAKQEEMFSFPADSKPLPGPFR